MEEAIPGDKGSSEMNIKKVGKKEIQNERTRTAFERLQLAWIRTCITIIAIGIAALEYYHNMMESGKVPIIRLVSKSDLGIFLIVTASVMLILSTLQHVKSMAKLKAYYPEMRYSVATVLSILILSLGLILLFILEKRL
jgi:uncharacterized membrane protein YidH (DUF202 family)